MRNEMLRRSLTDAETGLPNRRFFDLEVERVAARAERYRFPVGVITITCHGCAADVLRRFSRIMAESVRRADCLARTGPARIQMLVTHEDVERLGVMIERFRLLALEFQDEGFKVEITRRIESDPCRIMPPTASS